MIPERDQKKILLETFDISLMPDLDGEEAYRKAAAEAADVFGVKKPTHNQLKAYLLFGDEAVLIKEEIRFREET